MNLRLPSLDSEQKVRNRVSKREHQLAVKKLYSDTKIAIMQAKYRSDRPDRNIFLAILFTAIVLISMILTFPIYYHFKGQREERLIKAGYNKEWILRQGQSTWDDVWRKDKQ